MSAGLLLDGTHARVNDLDPCAPDTGGRDAIAGLTDTLRCNGDGQQNGAPKGDVATRSPLLARGSVSPIPKRGPSNP